MGFWHGALCAIVSRCWAEPCCVSQGEDEFSPIAAKVQKRHAMPMWFSGATCCARLSNQILNSLQSNGAGRIVVARCVFLFRHFACRLRFGPPMQFLIVPRPNQRDRLLPLVCAFAFQWNFSPHMPPHTARKVLRRYFHRSCASHPNLQIALTFSRRYSFRAPLSPCMHRV